ncbi:Pol polyprotein, partial [Mucuna pruriens]
MWGIDMIRPIKPKASNGHRFILVAIDYFTKWVEVTSKSTVTHNVVVKFIKRDIICQYGLSAHIITDNGTNLNNKMMIELCEQFKIRHHNSTPYHPKMNDAVEAANKNIKKIVQKMVKRIKKTFDKKVRPCVFKEGDMVLKKILSNTKDQIGKWTPKYEGPYIVKHAFSGGALILTNAEGHDLKHPINADVVKEFFP